MNNQARKRSPMILFIVLILAVVIGVGAGIYFGGQGNSLLGKVLPTSAQVNDANAPQANRANFNGQVDANAPSAGQQPAPKNAPKATEVAMSVSGDGILAAQDEEDVLTPAAVTIIQMPVKQGDEVTRGEVLARIDKDKLANTLSDLKLQQAKQDQTVMSLSGNKASDRIYSPIKGRIKKIYVEVGDDVQTVMKRDGALALLSTDGLMKVTFAPSTWENVRTGAEVTVKNALGTSWDGRVTSASSAAGEITVTFTDDGPKLDEAVTVHMGSLLGSGSAQINVPLALTATGGIVDRVVPTDKENAAVSRGTSILELDDVPISDTYSAALTKRQDLLDQISQCNTVLDSGEITAPQSGIVKAVYGNLTNVPLGKDTAILSLASNEKLDMVVSVDEMDVVQLKTGQQATVTVTALGNKTYAGTVKKIASVGKIVGGIAMYDVTIAMENAPGMRVSMSGSAVIQVAQ